MSNLFLTGRADAPAVNQAAWHQATQAYPGHASVYVYADALTLPADLPADTLLVVLASDAMPDGLWLSNITYWMDDHPDVLLAGTPVFRAREEYERADWHLFYPHLLRDARAIDASVPAPHSVQHIVRGAMLMRAGVYRQLGGFDPLLGDSFFADIDFCRRAASHDIVAWMIPEWPVSCDDSHAAAVDDAELLSFQDERLAFALKYGQTINQAYPGADIDKLQELQRQITSVSTSIDLAKRHAQVREFRFTSGMPVIGKLVSTFRQLWFSIGAKWAVLAFQQEQVAYNQHILEAIDQLKLAVELTRQEFGYEAQLIEAIKVIDPPGIEPLPAVDPVRSKATVERLTRMLERGQIE